jgi:AcrR family transcriptional regulator
MTSLVKPRRYRQQTRAIRAAATRRRLLGAARQALTRRPMRRLSIDEIALAAGVSRSTVYDTFGSREALLDAVAEDIFMTAGMEDVGHALAAPDPIDAIERAFPIANQMYASQRDVWRALESMAAIDASVTSTIARSEIRRAAGMRALAERLAGAGYLGPGVTPELAEAHLLVMTSFATFDLLAQAGRSLAEISDWMFVATRRTLRLPRHGGEG